ncbi:hypothetical protein J6590_004097 [Homalodisca vitripennis]|nr:hypothetical protein J6590_004097 [Homalodisca vitripennis]
MGTPTRSRRCKPPDLALGIHGYFSQGFCQKPRFFRRNCQWWRAARGWDLLEVRRFLRLRGVRGRVWQRNRSTECWDVKVLESESSHKLERFQKPGPAKGWDLQELSESEKSQNMRRRKLSEDWSLECFRVILMYILVAFTALEA